MSASTPSASWRAEPPDPGPIRPFRVPRVVASTLENGLELRIAPMADLPLVTVSLVLDAGEAALPHDRAGLAVLTGTALEGGTRRRSGADLAEALEGVGTTLHVGTGWDATTVSLSCGADRLQEALALLAEVVLEPAFPEEEVHRFREQRLAAIEQRRMDPASLADDRALHFFYADGVPYGRPLAGSPDSVGRLEREDTAEWARGTFRPGRAGLVVVGDVDLGEVEEGARRILGGWEGEPPPRPDFEARPRFGERRVVVVHRPGSVQSEIRIGQVGVARCSPDFFALQVFNAILGGAFTSRLMLNLRERHGFTYGVRSRFHFRRREGPFAISTAVDTEVTAPAVREVLRELEGILAEGPTEEEVEQARAYLVGIFPLRFETTGQVAARLNELLIHDLPEDFHAVYRERIAGVSREEALAAGRRALDPRRVVVLVVGDAERVRGPLEEAGIGPVEVEGDLE